MMEIQDRVKQYLEEGKTQAEAINLAYDSYYKEMPKMQQGASIKKKPFQLQDERNLVQRDATQVNTQKFRPLKQLNVRNKTDKEIAAEREAKIQASVKAQKTPYTKENWRRQLAAETAATGDKLRVSNEPNFFDDYLNPAAMIGSMASNLGQAPYQAQQSDSNLPYFTAIGAPLAAGALAGLGTKTTGQFVNNLANPLAGTGDLVNNLGNKYLPNAYKLNPKAITHESFNNSNSFYRQIDTPTFNEGLESGLIKGKQSVNKTQGENIINLNKSFGDDAYYFKGKLYSPQRADYIYEVNKGEEFFRPRVNNKDYLKKGVPYTVENTNVRVSRTPIPIEEATVYKKDWLQGYKQVEVPKEEMVDLYRIQQRGAKTFAQKSKEGTLPKIFDNAKTLAKKAEEEKYFGRWFTTDKNDLDWYLRDREFTNPEYIHTQIPKSQLSQYNIENFDKTLSRAPEREFILPQEVINKGKKYTDISQFQQGGTYTQNEIDFLNELAQLK